MVWLRRNCHSEVILQETQPNLPLNGHSRVHDSLPAAAAMPSVIRRRALWIVTLGLSMLLGVGGQLLMKYGLHSGVVRTATDPGVSAVLRWALDHPLVMAGLVTYCTGTLFWLVTVSRVDLSFVYPLTSLNFVLILLASYAFFDERVTWSRIAGVAAICLGVTLVTYKETANHGPRYMDSR